MLSRALGLECGVKRVVEWLTDHGFERTAMWLCERTGGHKPVLYKAIGIEPDWSCKHCPGDLY